ncbi:MAG: hypothetical protein K6A80_00645 [Saccharofermentans sp.]|nr:hypothetical protein [Saccharofermentans sp.]
MRTTNSVRSPKLASSGFNAGQTSDLSLGDVLRKAKKDLFFTRCVYAILVVMIITAIAAAVYFGYADMLVDWFFSLM